MAAPDATARLALFDLDGTLTRHDTYFPFVLGLLGRHPSRWVRVPLLVVPALAYLAGRMDRGTLKGAILRVLFGGMPRQQVSRWAARFAPRCLQTRMHAEGVRTLQRHLAAGDQVVVLSASPDLYVPLIGQLLGAQVVHCTPIRWNGDRLDGRLAGPNHRDHEKARVLARLRAVHPGLPVIAYGNSTVDLIHMRQCEQAVYVNAQATEAAELERSGIRCVRWN